MLLFKKTRMQKRVNQKIHSFINYEIQGYKFKVLRIVTINEFIELHDSYYQQIE